MKKLLIVYALFFPFVLSAQNESQTQESNSTEKETSTKQETKYDKFFPIMELSFVLRNTNFQVLIFRRIGLMKPLSENLLT